MAYDAESLTPDNYVLYRLARYGEAGRFGGQGARRAGSRHGVSARAWLYYESGHRRPSLTQRRAIATWLNKNTDKDGVPLPPEPTPEPNASS